MATAVLPISVVLSVSAIVHLTDTLSFVLQPAAFVAIACLVIAIDTCAFSDSVDEVALVDILVLVCGGSLAGEATGRGLLLVILSPELILNFVAVLRHAFFV